MFNYVLEICFFVLCSIHLQKIDVDISFVKELLTVVGSQMMEMKEKPGIHWQSLDEFLESTSIRATEEDKDIYKTKVNDIDGNKQL